MYVRSPLNMKNILNLALAFGKEMSQTILEVSISYQECLSNKQSLLEH